MAERRMFAKAIIDSDAFLDMPISSRLLYYDLAMRADDDGFVNSPKKIIRMIGASEDDIRELIAKKFILPFDNGVVVIKHWKIHNYIRKDTYKATNYKEQLQSLTLDENNAYTQAFPTPATVSNDSVDGPWTQDRIGKVRKGKVSIDKDKELRQKFGYYNNVLLSEKDHLKLIEEFPSDYGERIERLSEYIASTGKKYKDHLATIRSWAKREKPHKSKQEWSFMDLELGE